MGRWSQEGKWEGCAGTLMELLLLPGSPKPAAAATTELEPEPELEGLLAPSLEAGDVDEGPVARPLSPTRLQPALPPEAQSVPELEEVARVLAEIPRPLKRRGSMEQSPTVALPPTHKKQYQQIINRLFHRHGGAAGPGGPAEPELAPITEGSEARAGPPAPAPPAPIPPPPPPQSSPAEQPQSQVRKEGKPGVFVSTGIWLPCMTQSFVVSRLKPPLLPTRMRSWRGGRLCGQDPGSGHPRDGLAARKRKLPPCVLKASGSDTCYSVLPIGQEQAAREAGKCSL